MENVVNDRDELRPYERIFHILSDGFSFAAMILALLALLRFFHYWPAILSLACAQFCQSVYSWRRQSKIGLMYLCAGAVVLAVMVIVLLV